MYTFATIALIISVILLVISSIYMIVGFRFWYQYNEDKRENIRYKELYESLSGLYFGFEDETEDNEINDDADNQCKIIQFSK